MDPTVRKYFLSMNILLLNAYGMTETTGPHSGTSAVHYNPKEHEDFLEVGVPMPGCETVIKREKSSEEDGEICMRGRNVMMGYLKNAEETSKTIDNEGFIHSGDLGKISLEGYLYITGRSKELIVTAGG
jgi:long-chain-fatty-acid--CoA ligase ACSBG